MPNLAIIAAAIVLLAVLLFFERKNAFLGRLVTKTSLSSLFVAAAFLQPWEAGGYFSFLAAGLVLCLVGDVCLALPGEKSFMAGLVSFLLGHVMYIVAFFLVTDVGLWAAGGSVVVFAASIGVFMWLRPHLGDMKIPVLVYVLVISVMLTAAWSVFMESGVGSDGRLLVLVGAVMFYLSDITVAMDRFVKDRFSNKLVGLPLYFGGQFLLAFSAGYVS
ncbi:MAG: lysoplasmalogenase [Deltaproteobacteria bacterium]|nr:lysoplasmalogenase [Deltaproteobacteria bacterium]